MQVVHGITASVSTLMDAANNGPSRQWYQALKEGVVELEKRARAVAEEAAAKAASAAAKMPAHAGPAIDVESPLPGGLNDEYVVVQPSSALRESDNTLTTITHVFLQLPCVR